jgi:hypothetical protein
MAMLQQLTASLGQNISFSGDESSAVATCCQVRLALSLLAYNLGNLWR